MNLSDILLKKTDNIFIQIIRYGFVGGFAAVIDIGSFMFFSKVANIDYRLAIFLSFTLGTLTNFTISNLLVFERNELSLSRACVRHYLSSIGGLFVNEFVMITLVEFFLFDNLLIAKLVATGCAFFVNFLLIKFYAFNGKIRFSKLILNKG